MKKIDITPQEEKFLRRFIRYGQNAVSIIEMKNGTAKRLENAAKRIVAKLDMA